MEGLCSVPSRGATPSECRKRNTERRYKARCRRNCSREVVRRLRPALEQPKTKVLAKALTQLGIAGSTLLVIGDAGSNVVQAGKNLAHVTVLRPEELNVYDIVRCNSIVIPQRELDRFVRCGHEGRPPSGAYPAIVD